MLMIIVMKNVLGGSPAWARRMITNAAHAVSAVNCRRQKLAVNIGENAFTRQKRPLEAKTASSGRRDKAAHYACDSCQNRSCSSFVNIEVEE